MINLDRPGILGSGFGLYGYLPALIKSGSQRIFLPLRYKEKFSERHELKNFSLFLEWVKDDREVLDKASSLIVALNPEMQEFLVPIALGKKNICRLVLEKPLAACPQKSIAMLVLLIKSGKEFRINYIFRYLPWAKKLKLFIEMPNFQLQIKWLFNAHHFKNSEKTWKRMHHLGGGVLRFYGIHLVALMAEFGYTDILFSETYGENFEESWKWKASFSGNCHSVCNIEINSKCNRSIFSIDKTNSNFITENIVRGEGPFSNQMRASTELEDPRINFLSSGVFESFVSQNQKKENAFYTSVLLLWEKIERKNVFFEVT